MHNSRRWDMQGKMLQRLQSLWESLQIRNAALGLLRCHPCGDELQT